MWRPHIIRRVRSQLRKDLENGLFVLEIRVSDDDGFEESGHGRSKFDASCWMELHVIPLIGDVGRVRSDHREATKFGGAVETVKRNFGSYGIARESRDRAAGVGYHRDF